MVKFSKKATAVLLTVAMLLTTLCFSGMSVSAATTAKTVETAAGTATYKVMANTADSYISGASSVITYDTSKLTLVSAALTSDFAALPSVVNTSVAGQIKWNVVGDVSYTANTDKAIFEVTFTATEDVTTENIATYVKGSDFNLITNVAANSTSSATYATDGTGIVEEFGAPAAAVTPSHTPFELRDGVSGYKLQSQKVNGESVKILLGVMPKTSVADFKTLLKEIFWGTDFTVWQNNGTKAVTSGNIKAGYVVKSSDGTEQIYVAVRGDLRAAGQCAALEKAGITKVLKSNDKKEYFGLTTSTLGACKYYSCASLNAATNTSITALDKPAVAKYLKKGSF